MSSRNLTHEVWNPSARTAKVYANSARMCLGPGWEVLFQPVCENCDDARVFFPEHEMVYIGEQMQVSRLPGALEHLDGLLRRRD